MHAELQSRDLVADIGVVLACGGEGAQLVGHARLRLVVPVGGDPVVPARLEDFEVFVAEQEEREGVLVAAGEFEDDAVNLVGRRLGPAADEPALERRLVIDRRQVLEVGDDERGDLLINLWQVVEDAVVDIDLAAAALEGHVALNEINDVADDL